MQSWKKKTEDTVSHSCWFMTYNYCHNHSCHSGPHSLIGVHVLTTLSENISVLYFVLLHVFVCLYCLVSHDPSLSCQPWKQMNRWKRNEWCMDVCVNGHLHLCQFYHIFSKNTFFFYLPFLHFSFSLSASLSPFHFNTFKINTNLIKCKNSHTMNAYFNNVILLLFTPLWSCHHHRNDNPCWDSVASSQQIWMLNPLAKHHSQSELAMINNPTREIWLGETEAGDLREWITAMSALSGPQSDWKSHTEKTWNVHLQWVVSAVFLKTWVGTQNWVFGGMQLNQSWTSHAGS